MQQPTQQEVEEMMKKNPNLKTVDPQYIQRSMSIRINTMMEQLIMKDAYIDQLHDQIQMLENEKNISKPANNKAKKTK